MGNLDQGQIILISANQIHEFDSSQSLWDMAIYM